MCVVCMLGMCASCVLLCVVMCAMTSFINKKKTLNKETETEMNEKKRKVFTRN